MHILQPKYTILNSQEVEKLVNDLNISLAQLPKIKLSDISLPENSKVSDVVKIERISGDKKVDYYRVVIV